MFSAGAVVASSDIMGRVWLLKSRKQMRRRILKCGRLGSAERSGGGGRGSRDTPFLPPHPRPLHHHHHYDCHSSTSRRTFFFLSLSLFSYKLTTTSDHYICLSLPPPSRPCCCHSYHSSHSFTSPHFITFCLCFSLFSC